MGYCDYAGREPDQVHDPLSGIDAPEKSRLSGNVPSKASPTCCSQDRDRGDPQAGPLWRSVGKVLVDGVDANLIQVERGCLVLLEIPE